jgi:hypothetical protein
VSINAALPLWLHAALLDLASADAKTLSPTDLTSIALSMAKAGVVHRPLLRKIGELSAAQAQDLTSINCATLAWYVHYGCGHGLV